MWETPPEELPPEEPQTLDDPPVIEPETPVVLPHVTGPDQLLRDQRIPFDHARGAEYQSGEVPPGWNEPLP